MRKQKVPVLLGFVDAKTDTIRVWCPFCQAFHTHGAPEAYPDEPGSERVMGFRVPHCGTTSGKLPSPFRGNDYWIAEYPQTEYRSKQKK